MNQQAETKLNPDDLKHLQTNREEAINLIKHYARQYNGGEHYNQLGSSCVMSAVNTINTIINSSQNLNDMFLMPDEIHVERLVDWFLNNRNYKCDKKILTFFMADYLKRKVNELYRNIKKNTWESSLRILGNKESRNIYKQKINERIKDGVKTIRL